MNEGFIINVMTILQNVLRTSKSDWSADYRVDGKGEFYKVSDWLDRVWHWLCDFFADRTAVRTAKVFNEIYSLWGPTRDDYIRTAMSDAPNREGESVIQGMKRIQHYVSSKGDPFLEKMKKVDEVFRKNWDLFVALYPSASSNYDDEVVQKHDEAIGTYRAMAKLVGNDADELTRLRLRVSQDKEYIDSMTKDMAKRISELQEEMLKKSVKLESPSLEKGEEDLSSSDGKSKEEDSEEMRKKRLSRFNSQKIT